MKVLVTGGGGFVGQWLARALLERGDDVVLAGLDDRSRSPEILQPREWDAVRWISMDMRRDADVCAGVDATRPDLVVHLAGISFIPAASSAPTEAYDVNFLGAVRLLNELARRLVAGDLEPTVLVVGSATQYGRHDLSSMPLTESAEQRPPTVYAATKAAQEIVARQVFRATGLRVICTRSFNHSGVGHGDQYLLPALGMSAVPDPREFFVTSTWFDQDFVAAKILDPARVTSPATSKRSLMLTIVPSTGPSEIPDFARASAASAAVLACSR